MALSKRDVRKQETREALIRAGETLFVKQGFHATTVASIADAAGVTERTFFRYFNNKEDLVSGDIAKWLDTLEACLAKIPAETPLFSALEHAVLEALHDPGPIASWLLPIGSDGNPTHRIRATADIASQVAEIILRRSASQPFELPVSAIHPLASQRINNRFHATIVARICVAIVRTSIVTASQQAALDGRTASIDDIKHLITVGFSILPGEWV